MSLSKNTGSGETKSTIGCVFLLLFIGSCSIASYRGCANSKTESVDSRTTQKIETAAAFFLAEVYPYAVNIEYSYAEKFKDNTGYSVGAEFDQNTYGVIEHVEVIILLDSNFKVTGGKRL